MSRGWTKEKALLAAAAAVLLIAALKLSLVLSSRRSVPDPPRTAAPSHATDTDLGRSLAPPGLPGLAQRGHHDLFPKAPAPDTRIPPRKETHETERRPENKPKGEVEKQPDNRGKKGDERIAKKGDAQEQGGGGHVAVPTPPQVTLVAIVGVHGQPEEWYAVFRHDPTGALHRVKVGQPLLHLRLDDLQLDRATLIDPQGHRYTYPGRLAAAQAN
ncbi:MAG: hypothetical protein FJ291_31160 [Planctomycetes bacterium]|nr:hypothetical protein [Planctomycetota bacterium]